MDTPPTDQPAIKINRLTRRSRLVLVLTILIAAFLRLNTYLILPYDSQTPMASPIAILVDLIVITVIWLTASRYLNFTVALVAGLMYALNPWAVAWGMVVNISLTQFFITSAFAVALYTRLEDKNWVWVISLGSFIAGILSYIYLLIFIAFAQVDEVREPLFNLDGLVYIAHIATGIELDKSIDIQVNISYPAEIWLLWLGMATLIGVIVIWFQRYRLIPILLTAWVSIPTIFFIFGGLSSLTFFEHVFFIPLIPALCILAGAGVAWLIKLMPGKPYSRMIILSAYGVVFLSQALWWRGVLRYLELRGR